MKKRMIVEFDYAASYVDMYHWLAKVKRQRLNDITNREERRKIMFVDAMDADKIESSSYNNAFRRQAEFARRVDVKRRRFTK